MEHCPGCADDVEQIDHCHQYINVRGTAHTVWYVDGHVFAKLTDAALYVRDILECLLSDALDYAKSIPNKYG